MAAPRAARQVGQVAGGRTPSRGSGVAVIAISIAGGVLLYDLQKGKQTDQQKLRTLLSFGVGSVILVALAETVPELGVPLSVLLMLVVLIGRPQGLDFISKLVGNKLAATPAPKPAAKTPSKQGATTP